MALKNFIRIRFSDAIMQVATLTNQLTTNMCVILCIDGMQKLDHRPGSRDSHFYNTTSAICSVINVHHAFVIAICSATVYNTVNEVLSSSAQRRVSLIPPAVNPEPIFESKDDLTKLLASDMGGHGRALENLYTTLQEFNVENDDFAVIQHEVVAKIRMAYPDIVTHLNNLERFIVHVIARKKASSLQQSQVDDLLSLGLFRLRQDADLLEFPYILWLLWQSKTLPWANYTSWTPKKEEDVFATWEEWEHFNCSYRIIKSKAFDGDRVHWTDLHAGARFGPACEEIVDCDDNLDPLLGQGIVEIKGLLLD